MDERDLVVKFIGDDRDLQRAFTNTERRSKQFAGRMTSVNQTARGALSGLGSRTSLLFGSGAFIGSAALTTGIIKSVDAASDLNEEVSKSRQVFGDSSRAIEQWSLRTASAIGVSRTEALAATGTFGNLFKVVGAGQDDAAAMSRSLVELAADMASFNNANISDVLLAIRSGLIGEAEPLRRYGVLLSETRVQQAAMAATGKDNAKELTNQEKALARYNIILEDTASQQGDFERTSEGLANQQRILRARLADLSAEMGGKLLPFAVRTVSAFNDLFDLFSQRGDTLSPVGQRILDENDIQGLRDMRDRLAEVKGEGDLVVEVLDKIIARMKELEPLRPEDRAGLRGPGAIAISNRRVDAENADQEARQAQRNLERSRQRFQEFLKGMGLKLDRAGLTADLNDDLEVLRFVERAIQRRIRIEGRTFKLVEELVQVRQQIADTVAQQAENQANAARDKYQQIIDALNLNLARAQATAGLADDFAALADLQRAIEQRIQQEGRTTELMRELFEIRQQQAALREQQNELRLEQRQERQFLALGLTAEGDPRGPSTANLRRRLESLRSQVEGTFLDTDETRSKLRRISWVLSGEFGAVGRDVRDAIQQMFREINDALKEGGDPDGPLTAFRKIGTRKLTAGLAISAEDRRELRFRLAQVGRGGTVPQASHFGTGGAIIVNGDIIVDGGNPDAFMRALQNKAKKRAATRTGRRRGRRTGVG